MCTDPTPPNHGRHVLARPVLRDFEPPVMFDLEPVDAVAVTTLMDNVTDFSMPDQGPAHRATGMVAGGPPPPWRMAGASTPWWPSMGSRCS